MSSNFNFNIEMPQLKVILYQMKLNFWQSLEKDILLAYEAGCEVGPDVISDDPNNQTENGRLLIEMLARQNLHLVNASELCTGKITRQRIAAGRL